MSMKDGLRLWGVPLALGGLLVWAYGATLGDVAARWVEDPQYSHGFFVPVFALYLLWARRDERRRVRFAPSWWGVVVLAAGIGLWGVGTYFYLSWVAAISVLAGLTGLALAWGGRPALRWAWPAVLFLAFMVPLPYQLQTSLGGGLQRIATVTSTFALQTCGAPAVSEGNVILLNDARIGVVEACSGLGMLVTFVALSTAVVLVLRTAEWWLRLAVLASAVPVAILANVARITATGLLFGAAHGDWARVVFHDVAGWLMMPLAVLILLAEVRVLKRLVVDPPKAGGDAEARLWLSGLGRPKPRRGSLNPY